MFTYITRRLLTSILVLFGVSILVFSVIHLVPGDVTMAILGRQKVSPEKVAELRKQLGLPTVIHQGFIPDRWEDGTYSVYGAAKELGVFTGTIYTWIYAGRLQAEQVGKGTPWKIHLDEEKITALKSHLDRVKRSKERAA